MRRKSKEVEAECPLLHSYLLVKGEEGPAHQTGCSTEKCSPPRSCLSAPLRKR